MAVLILATGLSSAAIAATTLTDLVDFKGEQDDVNGVDYVFISATNAFSYTHTLIGLQTPPHQLLGGSLLLSHMGVSSNTAAEVWLAYTGSEQKQYIGKLAPSPSFDEWVLGLLPLPSKVVQEMTQHDPWMLLVSLEEETPGADKIRLDYSQLTVVYDTVPTPGSLLLLGSGLAALAAMQRQNGRRRPCRSDALPS